MSVPTPDRIYSQYRDKPSAVSWYKITRTLGDIIADAAQDVRRSYNVISGRGQQLDVLGRIVVIPREYIQTINLKVAEFNPDGKYEFGSNGAQFATPDLKNAQGQIADEFYRLVILAKIVRNNTDATIDGILTGLNTMLNERDAVILTDNEDMSFDLHFTRRLTDVERAVIKQLDVIARPQGVRIRNITEV